MPDGVRGPVHQDRSAGRSQVPPDGRRPCAPRCCRERCRLALRPSRSGVEDAPAGTPRAMTAPDEPLPRSLADTASESPAESVRREREAVGDAPDTGDLVPPDHAQAAPAPDGQ